MAAEDIYRESNKRRHKLLGAYLTLWSWMHKVDCVVFSRKTLLKFLELERMRNTRVDWMKEDLKELFPNASAMYTTSSGVYSNLYLSRFKFPAGFPWGSMRTVQRITRLKRKGLKTKEVKIPSESEMISTLAKVMQGIEDFPLP
jgi:hypothetical protein